MSPTPTECLRSLLHRAGQRGRVSPGKWDWRDGGGGRGVYRTGSLSARLYGLIGNGYLCPLPGAVQGTGENGEDCGMQGALAVCIVIYHHLPSWGVSDMACGG